MVSYTCMVVREPKPSEFLRIASTRVAGAANIRPKRRCTALHWTDGSAAEVFLFSVFDCRLTCDVALKGRARWVPR